MAAPVLANRRAVFVSKIGTDDAGYNAVGAPQARLTITAALADLLANYQPLTAAQPGVIAVGPGTYIEAGLQIPPNVFITGSADDESSTNTIIDLVGGDLELSNNWNLGACIGGIANLVIRRESTEVIDFTVPTPSAGNPLRVLTVENVTTDIPTTYEATSTADRLLMNRFEHDGTAPATVTLQGGRQRLHACMIDVATHVQDTAAIAADIRLTANYFGTLEIRELGAGTVCDADAISLPDIANLTQTGAITLIRLTDANGVGYTPSTPANWSPVPTTVQEALDELSGSLGPGGGSGALETNNAAGNTTITPTSKTWTEITTFTGAAGTRVVILDVAGATLGQTIDWVGSRVDGGGIIAEVRNATAGGTLLGTLPDGTGSTTGGFKFVYGTIAGGFPANAWTAISYQIPATT
jgi:hypothetical protein